MPSNNVPVNGWPQLKLLDKVQPILNELDKIERWQKSVKLVTRSGNVVTVPNALALDAQSLKVTFAPIQSGSGDPSPSNVRPISGHTGVGAVVCGKNQLNKDTNVLGYYIGTNGTPTSESTSNYTALIPVKTGNYVMSMIASSTAIGNKRVHGYDASGNWVRQLAVKEAPHSSTSITLPFTVTSDIAFIRLSYYTADTNVMIEEGTTATTYEAYKGQTHTTPFGDTYYSGYVDVVTGELVVTHAKKTITGSESGVTYNSYSNPTRAVLTGLITDYKRQTTNNAICDRFVPIDNSTTGSALSANDNAFNFSPQSNTQDIRFNLTGIGLADATAFQSYLQAQYAAGTPVEVVYELATPIRIALTPEQVTMFAGYITAYADIGPIEIVLYTGDSWS